MSWESTLKKITSDTALKAAAEWVDKPINLRLINNQINCVYRFEYQNKGYYLRITHEKIRSFEDVAAAIDFQNHLFQKNAPVPQPVQSKHHRFIECIRQDELEFFVHVCFEVPGNIMHFNHTEKSTYHTWGKSLALLHLASQSYHPKENIFKSWEDLWQETGDYAKQESPQIQYLHQQINAWFTKAPRTQSNFGLTHADHRQGNVLYDGQQVHIIDFDEPVYHWFMTDIARPLLDLCNEPQEKWKPLFDLYVEGYRSVLPISNDDLKALNWCVQMKSLDIYLWCKNNWFEETAPGGKSRDQWLSELKQMALTPLFN